MSERAPFTTRECDDTREIIARSVNYLNRTTLPDPKTEPELYEEIYEQHNKELDNAREACDNKPEGCSIERDPDDEFSCDDCGFFRQIIPEGT